MLEDCQTHSKQQLLMAGRESTHFAGLDRKRSRSLGLIEETGKRETVRGWLYSLQVQYCARLDRFVCVRVV